LFFARKTVAKPSVFKPDNELSVEKVVFFHEIEINLLLKKLISAAHEARVPV
jgi:hypothetical protein